VKKEESLAGQLKEILTPDRKERSRKGWDTFLKRR